ncbi:hypothetical protein ACFFNY_14330 [Paenibacillus hodogayensis]|uniref:Uncharacterized protein n=1 Tax=Paenibacillus hodogayensis TaxID=279208 RepID=A0ABV5VWQ1_9BACL
MKTNSKHTPATAPKTTRSASQAAFGSESAAKPAFGTGASWITAQRTMGNRAVGRMLEQTVMRRAEPLMPISTASNTAVQRLMSEDSFKKLTKVDYRIRSKIKPVDKALAKYNATDKSDYVKRDALLDDIRMHCENYLAHPKAHPDRIAGVQTLLGQIDREKEVYVPLAEASAAADPKTRFAKLCEGQDALLAIRDREALGLDNMSLDTQIMSCLEELKAVPGAIDDILQQELNQLLSIMNAPDTPDITKRVLAEVLNNADKVHMKSHLPGARLTNQKEKDEGIGEKYVVNHRLVAPLGTTERLGSLAHELTHVSVSEQFDNSQLFFAFPRDASDDEVMDLVHKRHGDLDALLGLLDRTVFTGEQIGLLNSKLEYPRKYGGDGVRRYIGSFFTAKKITAEEKVKFEGLVEKGMDNSVIEFDTVINQMLIYMQQWKVPQDNPFYEKLRSVAEDAYAHRTGG